MNRLVELTADIRRRLAADEKAADIIFDLVRVHGARYTDRGGTYELRLGGVTRSCTGGPISLLLAWCEKATAASEAAR